MCAVGAWLSLVERLVRDQEAGGSNPLAPTISLQRDIPNLGNLWNDRTSLGFERDSNLTRTRATLLYSPVRPRFFLLLSPSTVDWVKRNLVARGCRL